MTMDERLTIDDTVAQKFQHQIKNGAKVIGFITKNEYGRIAVITRRVSWYDEKEFYSKVMRKENLFDKISEWWKLRKVKSK